VRMLIEIAREVPEGHVVERSHSSDIQARLPRTSSPHADGSIVMRWTAIRKGRRIHVTAQDITQLRWLESTFSRFVAPGVIDKLRGLPSEHLLQMETRVVSILFADLRGFTRLSQQLSATEIQEMVNSFFANAVDEVQQLQGTVDKFIGDEIMVLFGAPMPFEDHALRALTCAVRMRARHAQWMEERESRGLPAPAIGIGLTSGSVAVGNVGTPERMEYTALGHSVNLAARLCGKAEPQQILTTRQTYISANEAYRGRTTLRNVPRLKFTKAGDLNLKNVNEPVEAVIVNVSTTNE
ncbi:MAG: adenylate/guanylate cyclase domain-containing protein, partial [Myxococcota bacterium]